MGVHSTMSVSREAALRKLQGVDWEKLSNEQLGSVLDALLYDTLYNFAVDRFGDEDDTNLKGLNP
jgi:hypothetical protein